jgi:hypothetical protein
MVETSLLATATSVLTSSSAANTGAAQRSAATTIKRMANFMFDMSIIIRRLPAIQKQECLVSATALRRVNNAVRSLTVVVQQTQQPHIE